MPIKKLIEFFAKKESTEDEERRATRIIMPENVDTLVVMAKEGSSLPKDAVERNDYVWRLFRSINPVLHEMIPDKGAVKTACFETDRWDKDGYVELDAVLDMLDSLRVPQSYSAYIQTIGLSRGTAIIRLREESGSVKTFELALTEPYDESRLPDDVALITVYQSREGKLISSVWPAEPRVRCVPERLLKDYEKEMLRRDELKKKVE